MSSRQVYDQRLVSYLLLALWIRYEPFFLTPSTELTSRLFPVRDNLGEPILWLYRLHTHQSHTRVMPRLEIEADFEIIATLSAFNNFLSTDYDILIISNIS